MNQKSGRSPISNAHMRDIDKFFAGLRIAASTVDKLEEFREWRESQAHVLEYKQENIEKEIALRTMQALNRPQRKLDGQRTRENYRPPSAHPPRYDAILNETRKK